MIPFTDLFGYVMAGLFFVWFVFRLVELVATFMLGEFESIT